MHQTGLTFLGIGIGEIFAYASMPLWNRYAYSGRYYDILLESRSFTFYRFFLRSAVKYGGKPPPEIRLYMGQLGGILVPISTLLIFLSTRY